MASLSEDSESGTGGAADGKGSPWSAGHGVQRPAAAVVLRGSAHALELWRPHEAARITSVSEFELERDVQAGRPWERRLLRDHDDALACGAPLFPSTDDLTRLRSIVASCTDADVWRLDQHGLLAELARVLLAGRLWLMRRQPVRHRLATTSSPAASPTVTMTPSMMRERPPSAPAPAPKPDVDPIRHPDQAAQAAVLLRAAAAGVPFCEECERLRNEQGIFMDEVAEQDVQAASLLQAAEEGAPFCEECEKLKNARQRNREPEVEMA